MSHDRKSEADNTVFDTAFFQRKLADYEKKEKAALGAAIARNKRQKKEAAENQDVTDAIISALE